ncbi:MAG: hypothetical protein ACLVEJ_18625 [Parabacteroides sp.]
MIQADNIDPSMTGFIPDLYEEAYSAIARMNIFLYQLKNYEGADMNIVHVNQCEGEVLFFFVPARYYLLYFVCYEGSAFSPTEPRWIL